MTTIKTGAQARKRININEDYEVGTGPKKIGGSSEELKRAVRSVGTPPSRFENS
jgi:hypothetical protein